METMKSSRFESEGFLIFDLKVVRDLLVFFFDVDTLEFVQWWVIKCSNLLCAPRGC